MATSDEDTPDWDLDEGAEPEERQHDVCAVKYGTSGGPDESGRTQRDWVHKGTASSGGPTGSTVDTQAGAEDGREVTTYGDLILAVAKRRARKRQEDGGTEPQRDHEIAQEVLHELAEIPGALRPLPRDTTGSVGGLCGMTSEASESDSDVDRRGAHRLSEDGSFANPWRELEDPTRRTVLEEGQHLMK